MRSMQPALLTVDVPSHSASDVPIPISHHQDIRHGAWRFDQDLGVNIGQALIGQQEGPQDLLPGDTVGELAQIIVPSHIIGVAAHDLLINHVHKRSVGYPKLGWSLPIA